MSSLYEQLRDAVDTCVITKNPFLPLNIVFDAITTRKIRDIMPLMERLRLRLLNRDFDMQIQKARKVIAILALLDRLDKNSLRSVIANGLIDEHLPLRKNGQQLVSQHLGNGLSFPSLGQGDIDTFIKKQWLVITPDINLEAGFATNILLEEDCPLPFVSVERVDSTVFSKVYKAEFRSVLNDPTRSKSQVIAVKKFIRPEHARETDYSKEKEILDEIQSQGLDNNHLVRHLAVCDRIQCIIFPWANGGNLESFWARTVRNDATSEILLWSLKQLAGLAHALADLHRLNIRHGDLKPSNILHFDGGQNDFGILKIADVGVSRVHQQDTKFRLGPTITRASTLIYEGPEANDRNKNRAPRSRKFDCWSMGCIMLEFVIWMLYDHNAVGSFKQARQCADNSYYEALPINISEEVAWQDTMRRYPKVDEAIDYLRNDERCGGAALEKLINIADLKLLKIDPDDRCLAMELHAELAGLLKNCQEKKMELIKPRQCPIVPEIFSTPSEITISAKVQHTYDTSIKL